ncbi:hypothetical protein [Roseomonas sp. 18066]|uniref:hypothetical protein n=1 Tax=Roseomonas sp. 18066 TaxID=2681412 RepID=UPI00135B9ADB|nr:hypothetical protein [Roseomonas sp. 18066]
MSHERSSQMQEAIACALRFREKMPNTMAAGFAAMDTAASIMNVVAAAGLTLEQASTLNPELPPLLQSSHL